MARNKKSNMMMKLLTDPKHWIGWAITTGTLIGVFSLLPTSTMDSILTISFITLGIIVGVDLIKHQVGLQ